MTPRNNNKQGKYYWKRQNLITSLSLTHKVTGVKKNCLVKIVSLERTRQKKKKQTQNCVTYVVNVGAVGGGINRLKGL